MSLRTTAISRLVLDNFDGKSADRKSGTGADFMRCLRAGDRSLTPVRFGCENPLLPLIFPCLDRYPPLQKFQNTLSQGWVQGFQVG